MHTIIDNNHLRSWSKIMTCTRNVYLPHSKFIKYGGVFNLPVWAILSKLSLWELGEFKMEKCE